jgi:hypothetical protein
MNLIRYFITGIDISKYCNWAVIVCRKCGKLHKITLKDAGTPGPSGISYNFVESIHLFKGCVCDFEKKTRFYRSLWNDKIKNKMIYGAEVSLYELANPGKDSWKLNYYLTYDRLEKSGYQEDDIRDILIHLKRSICKY